MPLIVPWYKDGILVFITSIINTNLTYIIFVRIKEMSLSYHLTCIELDEVSAIYLHNCIQREGAVGAKMSKSVRTVDLCL